MAGAHRFPGFDVIDRFATSPRSTVERAIRIADGARVVLKQSTAEVTAGDALRRLHHERELIVAARGEGVVGGGDILRDGNHAALVTADAGPTLAAWAAGRRCALGEALDAASAVARGLARIHAADIIHCDLNPSNIAYDPERRTATIIDFDLARRASDAGGEQPPAGWLAGTLYYIAPEQTGRLGCAVDARADLYALGITLYELIAGRRPFAGDDALALVHAHLAEQPARLDELVPDVPAVVADIVAKLITKAPDQRYQTAAGVLADLEQCRRALDATGAIAAFAIAGRDGAARFALPNRLYGRTGELRALLDAFDRIAGGGVETVLVSGYAGIGKSSIVREMFGPVLAHRGRVASGKFEQLNRDLPYSAVVVALGELVSRILAEPALESWRAAIAGALGDTAPLVRSVLPAIERVLGPQPAPTALDPDTARRRLAHGLSRLVQVFAQTAHPLVLFLDDMQWADAASLGLLTELATSERTASLLVVEAYRDNEVDPSLPYASALRDHERRGARVSRIALAPLALAETVELVADALRRPPGEVGAVAAEIWRKTEGNPFFIRQFMQMLHDDGYLAFDPGTRGFTFDLPAITGAAITDNVAELLAHQLGKLPAATRDVLVTAAGIGNRFAVAMLATVAGRPAAAVHDALDPAVAAGMIAAAGELAYRFQHDRIQQAAYELAPADARERLHLAIARQLLSASESGGLDDRLFAIVHHYNSAIALVVDCGERARFAELAVAAARRARRSGATDVAATMLRSACALRDPRDDYAGWFEARLALAEVLWLGGANGEARATVAATSQHATPRDRASLEALDTAICCGVGLLAEALVCARRAAVLLGVELPADPGELARATDAEIGAVMGALAARPVEQWIDLPMMTDPDKLAVMALLFNCLPAAYQSEPALFGLLTVKLITLSLAHGHCGASSGGYIGFAITLWTRGDYDLAYRVGKLAIDLVRRVEAPACEPAMAFAFAAFAEPWQRPLDESIARLRDVVARGADLGDVAHAGYAAAYSTTYAHVRGTPLDELCDQARRDRRMCERLGLTELELWLRAFPAHIRSFTGAAPARGEHDVDLAAIERTLAGAAGSQTNYVMLRALELERRYWQGDHAGAVDVYSAIAPMLPGQPGHLYNAEARFYHCLAVLAVGAVGAALEADRRTLARYAAACPANFRAMSLLVDAEHARSRGEPAVAVRLYDAAIEAAQTSGFLKIEILGHELAARCWLAQHKPAFAAIHLGAARDACELWGARPRAHALEVERRGLGATSDQHVTKRSTSMIASTLDFATVVKASQAIASDIVLDSLLAKIMVLIIENTGAQAGAIVLDHGGEPMVHASKQSGAPVAVGGGVPLDGAGTACEGIVRYALRTGELVVIGDATRHPTFRSDPYVRARRPRSALCLPIVHQERMIGAVYLENNLVAEAFTLERLEAVGILVAQLAISIENAMMVSQLEQRVAERTRELTEANRQLREEVLVRERMESELRLAQKLQSVGQLAAGVAHEINTPTQFIGDNLAFLSDAVGSLLGLVEAYHGAIDPDTGRIDQAAVRAAEDDCDLDYVRSYAPSACVRAKEGVARVTAIVLAMKAFSHPDRAEQAPAALNSALRNTLVVAQNEYRYVADVVTELGELPDVVCHIGELNQVFLNLIVNAAHAIEDVVGGTGARGTITVHTRLEDDDTVLVTIADTGSGIPDTIRERVFDPFFTTKQVGRGTGQGLALARTAIVDRHAGRISFESEPGRGTTFFVRLPVNGRRTLPAVAVAS